MLALVSPRPSTRSTPGIGDERVGQRAIGADREDVDVAAGLGAAPQAADGGDLSARRAWPCRYSTSASATSVASIEQVAAGVTLPLFEGAQDQLLLLRAHAFERANAA